MGNVKLLTTCCLVTLGTLGSGWLHGRLVNRWGEAKALETAAQRFQEPLPARLGPWRLASTPEMEAGELEILQSAAHLQGVYMNDQTGESVIVQLVVGPGGPISAHTPEICYAGQEILDRGREPANHLARSRGTEAYPLAVAGAFAAYQPPRFGSHLWMELR